VTIINASLDVLIGAGSAAIGSSWCESLDLHNASLARAQVDFVGIYGGESVLWAMDGPMIGTGAGICGASVVKEVVIDGARIRPQDDVQAGRAIGTYNWVTDGGTVGIDVVRFKAGHLTSPPGLPVSAVREFVLTNGTIEMNASTLKADTAIEEIGEIRFEQGEDDLVTFFCPFANQPCWVSQAIGGQRVRVFAVQGTPKLFSTGLEGTTSLDLYIQYLDTSEPEPIDNFPLLRLIRPEVGRGSKVRVGRIADNWTRHVEYEGPNGFLMALPEVGAYEVRFRTPGAVTHDVLCHGNGSILQIGLGDSLFENMSVCIPSPTPTPTSAFSHSLSFSPSSVFRASGPRTFTPNATGPLPTTAAALPIATPTSGAISPTGMRPTSAIISPTVTRPTSAVISPTVARPTSTVILPTATGMLAMTTVRASSGEVVHDEVSGTLNAVWIGVSVGVGVAVVGGLIGCCVRRRRQELGPQSETGDPVSRSSGTGNLTRREHEFDSVGIGEENDPFGFDDPDVPWGPATNAPLYASLATPVFPV
jgi:hypothetical protein